ncbi:MAG: hypothetical protein ON057_000559 [Glomeribacter sp. 1016415]|nr:hypothetical protein [Glomeribacter sp. 1016415]
MRISMANVTRRFALGVDVNSNQLRAIVLSRRFIASAAIRIEHMGVCALPVGAVVGADFIDPEAIAAALSKALLACRCKKALAASRAAMAVPASATLEQQVSIAQLAPQHGAMMQSDTVLDVLESAVLAQAEHLAGIEATALAVDWFRLDPTGAPDQLTIIATPRRYVEARLEAAAQAGIMLHAIDGADAAALRSCRFAVMQAGQADRRYGALWLSAESGRIWLIYGHSVERELKFSRADLATPTLMARLHELVSSAQPVSVFFAGEVDKLPLAGRTVDELSSVLRCPVIEFDPLACCSGNPRKRSSVQGELEKRNQASLACGVAMSFAVAFGLALRWMV